MVHSMDAPIDEGDFLIEIQVGSEEAYLRTGDKRKKCDQNMSYVDAMKNVNVS